MGGNGVVCVLRSLARTNGRESRECRKRLSSPSSYRVQGRIRRTSARENGSFSSVVFNPFSPRITEFRGQSVFLGIAPLPRSWRKSVLFRSFHRFPSEMSDKRICFRRSRTGISVFRRLFRRTVFKTALRTAQTVFSQVSCTRKILRQFS